MNLLTAYGISMLTILTLLMFGIRNRQTGWRRERHDSLTDVLMTWAELSAAMRQTAVPVHSAKSPVFGTQIAALNQAVSGEAGSVAPAAGGEMKAAEAAVAQNQR